MAILRYSKNNTPLSEIFNDDTECTYLNERERSLIENFRTLSEEKADALLNLSDVLKK